MKASETTAGQTIRWTKEGITREGTVRAFDESEHVIGVFDHYGRVQIIEREQDVEVVE